MLAFEEAMDELAVRSTSIPSSCRLRNEPKDHPESSMPFSTRALVHLPAEGAETLRLGPAAAQARGTLRDGHWLFGMGMSAAIRGNLLRQADRPGEPGSRRQATVEMAMTDIGTGTYTILAQIAAEALGLPIEQDHGEARRQRLPLSPGSGGSFGAASSGAGLFDACRPALELAKAGSARPGRRQAASAATSA